jgi:hypothetical protein
MYLRDGLLWTVSDDPASPMYKKLAPVEKAP